jgi:hypothetical protein
MANAYSDPVGVSMDPEDERAARLKDLLDQYRATRDAAAAKMDGIKAVDQAEIDDALSKRSDRNFGSSLLSAANKIGNLNGEAVKSNYGDYADKQSQIEMDGLKSRNSLYDDSVKRLGIAQQQLDDNTPVETELVDSINEQLTAKNSKIKLPSNITWKQVKASPFLNALVENATKAQQQQKTYMKDIYVDGVPRTVLVDGTTGEILKNVGAPTSSTSIVKDPVTGAYTSVEKRRGSTIGGKVVNNVNGKTPNELKDEREVNVAKRKAEVAEGVKDAKSVRESSVATDMEEDFRNDILNTRSKATLVGPVGGRISDAAQSLGISLDKDATELNIRLQKRLSAYMKEVSGATVPDEEVKRLAKQIPNIKDDEDTFKSKLDELFGEAKRIAKKYRAQSVNPSDTEPKTKSQNKKRASDLPDLN